MYNEITQFRSRIKSVLQIANRLEMITIFPKKKLLIVPLLFVGIISLYCNRSSSIKLCGATVDSYYRWGQEYILAKDLIPLGFEGVWEADTLSFNYKIRKTDEAEKNNLPVINLRIKGNVALNGIEIDYKMIHGEIAFCIDDFCNLDSNAENDIHYPDAHYTAFRQLGYSAYYFRKDSSNSVSFLPLEESVLCNIGEIRFTEICEDAEKSEMAEYFDLESVLRKMNAKYAFRNNVLDIYEEDFRQITFSLPDETTNYTALGYPVLAVEVFTADGQKISAYIDRGRLKINLAEFSEAYGYYYNGSVCERNQKMIVVGKGLAESANPHSMPQMIKNIMGEQTKR